MKHTLLSLWAKVRRHQHEVVLGAITGIFLAMTSVSPNGGYQAHFLQRPSPQETAPKSEVVKKPTRRATNRILLRKQQRKVSLSHKTAPKIATQQKKGVRLGQRTAMGLVDEDLHTAAPASSSSISTSVASSAAPAARIAAQTHPAAPAASATAAATAQSFPALVHTAHPVSRVPNWGAMRTPAEWNRTYSEMKEEDFVGVPAYDLHALTIPMSTLTSPITSDSINLITAKLYYSTRYLGAYDLDAGEHSGTHDGVDLKLAIGTPIGAIGGGRVYAVHTDATLGLHVLIEHQLGDGTYALSIYGHLGSASVKAGQDIAVGQTVGVVGMTGNTSGPHLHLSVHTSDHQNAWNEYTFGESVNPMGFIAKHRSGE